LNSAQLVYLRVLFSPSADPEGVRAFPATTLLILPHRGKKLVADSAAANLGEPFITAQAEDEKKPESSFLGICQARQ
jgi:hypothetical protein